MGVLAVIEADAAYQAARRLVAALAGRPLELSTFRGPDYAALDLRGRRVGSVVSRGKHVLIRAGTLIIHMNLGLDGRWEPYAPGERARTPWAQAHCLLRNAEFRVAGFEFGDLSVFRARDELSVFRSWARTRWETLGIRLRRCGDWFWTGTGRSG